MSRARTRYRFFDTAEECADSAVVEFRKRNWTWVLTGVPSRDLIIEQLKKFSGKHVESGRLCLVDGKFGHLVLERGDGTTGD